jgi:caffeoyl-CoA O-methyltransferase
MPLQDIRHSTGVRYRPPPMILAASVERYLAGLVPEPDAVLAEMRAHGARDGIPIVVPEAGALLGVLARAAGARTVVEVGTAIGVSTLHLARAVGPGGRVISFEIDAERQAAARDYLTRAGVIDRTDLRLQDAAAGLRALTEPLDMAFLDGLKGDYPEHLELILARVRPGGVVAVDNVLLTGTVATGQADGYWSEEHIERMRAFNRRLVTDPRLDATVLPVGDGIAVAVVRTGDAG